MRLLTIVVIALIRTLMKASKGESINVPPVGVMNDLPSSVTGINKHYDIDNNGLVVRGLAIEADKETLLEISADKNVYRIVTEEIVK